MQRIKRRSDKGLDRTGNNCSIEVWKEAKDCLIIEGRFCYTSSSGGSEAMPDQVSDSVPVAHAQGVNRSEGTGGNNLSYRINTVTLCKGIILRVQFQTLNPIKSKGQTRGSQRYI